jgi:hypothetical protein
MIHVDPPKAAGVARPLAKSAELSAGIAATPRGLAHTKPVTERTAAVGAAQKKK